jgi:hypothetical protein
MAPVKQLVRAALLAAIVLVALPSAADAAITVGTSTPAHWSPGTGPTTLLPNATAASTEGDAIAFAYIYQNDFVGSEDELSWAPTSETGDITVHYNSLGGDLTLSSAGGATDAQWEAALRAVRYVDTSLTPSLAPRTIYLALKNSDASVTSNPGSTFVYMTGTDAAPVVDAGTGSAAYLRGAAPVVVAPALTVSDADDPGWAGAARVGVGDGWGVGDTLSFTNDDASAYGSISGSYDSVNQVLTLTSADWATATQWRNALRAVAFSTSSTATSTRMIAFSVSDGTVSSSTVDGSVTVTSPDPVVGGSFGPVEWTQGDNTAATPVVVDGAIVLSDADSTTLASGLVTITNGFRSGEDVLAFDNDDSTAFGNIDGTYTSGTGELALTSSGATATLLQWQNALRAVTYTNRGVHPNTSPRMVAFAVDDGQNASATRTSSIGLHRVEQSPVLTGSSGSAAWTQGDDTAATPVVVDGAIVLSDTDDATLASGLATITNGFRSGEDVLAFHNDDSTAFGNIDGTYTSGTGELALTSSGATATLAQWAAALQAITYTNSADAPDTAVRTISFTVSDGSNTSTAVTRDVTLATVDQTPVVTLDGSAAAFTEGDAPVAVDPSLAVADADDAALPAATVAITGGLHADEDVLAFGPDGATGDVVAAYDAGTGELALTSAGGASPAQWQAALRAVTYADTSEAPSEATRTLTFRVDDGEQQSAAQTRDVAVTAVADAPEVTGSADALTVQAGGPAVVADPAVTVSDADSPSLTSTASIVGGYDAATDVLAWDKPDGSPLDATFDAGQGTLTLTGTGTPAEVQAALRAVTFRTSTIAAAPAPRTIRLAVGDADHDTAGVTRTVAVTPIPPVPAAQTPASAPAPPATLPLVAPGSTVPGVLTIPLPGASRAPVAVDVKHRVTVSCVVKSPRAATCAADLFATDPGKAHAAAAVRGRLLGRGTAKVAANHAGTVKVAIALNAAGRALAAHYPQGFAAQLRVIAHYAGTRQTSRATRSVRIRG